MFLQKRFTCACPETSKQKIVLLLELAAKKYGRQLKQINLDSTWFTATERQMLVFSIAALFRKINDRLSMKNGMKLSEGRYPPGKLRHLSF
ncbi:Fumigaclavine A dimethylallyltransferase easL [Trichinella spiralis]|uniref:Fumigaclavine A dimethylallyltransferase easL n=1 Tax=Trichinella spiralis TaxID=6334 RepID=A0ABR3K3P2_TRISP